MSADVMSADVVVLAVVVLAVLALMPGLPFAAVKPAEICA
jgi:hypothetical protein